MASERTWASSPMISSTNSSEEELSLGELEGPATNAAGPLAGVPASADTRLPSHTVQSR